MSNVISRYFDAREKYDSLKNKVLTARTCFIGGLVGALAITALHASSSLGEMKNTVSDLEFKQYNTKESFSKQILGPLDMCTLDSLKSVYDSYEHSIGDLEEKMKLEVPDTFSYMYVTGIFVTLATFGLFRESYLFSRSGKIAREYRLAKKEFESIKDRNK